MIFITRIYTYFEKENSIGFRSLLIDLSCNYKSVSILCMHHDF